MKEVKFLMKRDANAGKIDFVDIASPSYSAEANLGITFHQAMERIHAILPDGTIVQDIEVFRRLYEAVGLGWVYAITKYKVVENVGNVVYHLWAKYRTQMTGREALEVILQRRQAEAAGLGDAGSLCREDGHGNISCKLPVASGTAAKPAQL
eukprot:GHRR01020109.1.p1 GENE.GHRR01020109.1~~GHRR01020109.1.p1  ORF type:complete len:152 (+),score=51.95 GHRR01020109.1:364-819(+)